MSEQDRARQLRRRHMHERQAVIFGVLLAALALAGLGAAAMFTGSLNLPVFARGFEAEPTATATQLPYPCPPAAALPVAANQVTVRVFNATTRVGLAGATGASLQERGFVRTEFGRQVVAEFVGHGRGPFLEKSTALADANPPRVIVLNGGMPCLSSVAPDAHCREKPTLTSPGPSACARPSGSSTRPSRVYE